MRRTRLTPREREVLQCLMQGMPNKLIARTLGMTEATVKVHVKSILRTTGTANRTQAAMGGAKILADQPQEEATP